jgi:hypothetical protein
MPQRLVPPSRRLGAGGLPSHALWQPAPAHIFGADAGTLFLRGPEDGCRCRMSSDAPVTRPGPEPNPRAFLCFLQSETAQLAAYAVFSRSIAVSRVGRHVALQLRHCLQRVQRHRSGTSSRGSEIGMLIPLLLGLARDRGRRRILYLQPAVGTAETACLLERNV